MYPASWQDKFSSRWSGREGTGMTEGSNHRPPAVAASIHHFPAGGMTEQLPAAPYCASKQSLQRSPPGDHLGRPRGDDAVRRRPLGQVPARDGCGHHLREKVGRAGEAGDAQRREARRRVVVISRRAAVVECQERYHLRPGGYDARRPLEQLLPVAALVEVADKDQDGVLGGAHQSLAV